MLLACLVVLLVTAAVSMVPTIIFFLRLKRYEHDVYLSLGSPLKPMGGRIAHLHRSAAILLFLKNDSHRSLRDEKSARLGELVVLTNRILLGIIVLVCTITGYIILFVKP